MGKTNKKNKNRKNKQKAARKPAAGKAIPVLDQPARDYAELVADPCNAQLVHPIYAGGDAGFLFRAESFVTISGVGTTSGVVHWTPGYVNGTGTELLYMKTGGSSTAVALAALPNTPGKTFLTSNAKGVRCIGACLKITYPGAESTRSGRVHYGLTSAGMMDVTDSVTVDQVAQTLQHYGRTPAESVEVIWRPGVADQEFNDPTESAGAIMRDRKTAVTVAFTGLPDNTGLTFHMTAIYEWTPAVNLGVGHNALGKARSRNTLDDVIDYLMARGETFVRGLGVPHGMAGGVVDLVRTAFGSMPAMARTRASSY